MASTYSTNLKIELIGTGDQSGTWGTTTNTNLGSLIEEAIAGYVTQAVTDGAATVLTIPNGTSSNGRNYVIELTGTLSAARTVEVPAVDKPYIFFNNTTGGYAVTVKVNGQTGVTIANGKKAIVYTNSTDVIEVVNAPVSEAGTQTLTNKTLTSPTVNSPVVSGGTINNAAIGGSTPAAGAFTTLSASGALTASSTLAVTGDVTVDTNVFKVDTSNNRVGINTASPAVTLAVNATDAVLVPVGTTGERPTGATGYLRFNSSTTSFEGYNGTAWGSIGGGATGGGTDQMFYLNGQTVTTNYSVPSGQNAGTFGPITVDSGATVTVPSGSTWTVI